MKHYKVRFVLLLLFIQFEICHAQFTKLQDMAGTSNGSIPFGDLISAGSFLYGTASSGGANGQGALFKIKPDGTGDSVLLNFTGSNGSNPYGSLISDGTFLYGMTYRGGANNMGTTFKIKYDGTGYSKLLDFAGTFNGQNPNGSLIYDGNFLYGMTLFGGSNGQGIIFRIKTDGTGFLKLLDFSGGQNGSFPYGSLVSDGTFLYGLTSRGGTHDKGIIFKIKTDGTGYSILLNFFYLLNAETSYGTLMYDGNFLYGMTYGGGANNLGIIFKLKTDGSGFTKLFDFNGMNGSEPMFGKLFSDGVFLFGMTNRGGAYDYGTLFKIRSDGTNYSKLFDFTGAADGRYPHGSVMFDGTYLYGTTSQGGINDLGSVFKYVHIINDVNQTNVKCKGGSNGSATVSANGGTAPYSYTWSTVPMQTTQTATGLSAGTYTIYVMDANNVLDFEVLTITQPDTLILAASSLANVSCFEAANGVATVSGSGGTMPYSYLWSNNATTQTITGLTASNYSITVSDTNGCVSSSTVAITQPAILSATVLIQNVSCNGGSNGSAAITAAGGTSPYFYLWNNGQSSGNATALVAGNYIVTITDSNNCIISDTVNISQPPVLASTITASSAKICKGNCSSLYEMGTSGGTPPYTYLWLPLNVGADSIEVCPSSKTTYTCVVSDSSGCKLIDTTTIRLYPPLSAPLIVQNGFTISSSASASTYQWYLNGALQTQYTTQNITIASAENGNWMVYVTDSFGCSDSSSLFSSNVGMNELQNNLLIAVSPNPSNGIFTIQWRDYENSQLGIYNVIGEEIYSDKLIAGNDSAIIDISSHCSGIYFLKITTRNGSSAVRKIIKE